MTDKDIDSKIEVVDAVQRESDGVIFEVSELRMHFFGWLNNKSKGLNLKPNRFSDVHVWCWSLCVQVDQRVSFIDPQSGMYTDGVVVAIHGPKKMEVGYWRSSWSDPK